MVVVFPRTREEDYIEFQRKVLKLHHDELTGNISEDEARVKHRDLIQIYGQRIFADDIIFFNNPEDLTRALEADGVDRKSAIDGVNHEVRHGRVALEMGYGISYSCVRTYCRKGEKLVLKLFPRVGIVNGTELDPSDLVAIAHAVDNPSHLDLQIAQTYSQVCGE